MDMTQFINPYNFFPLGEKRATAEEQDGEKLTGVIEYSLLTKTPLFIPNTSNDRCFKTKVEGHKAYDFFSYSDRSDTSKTYEDDLAQPVIPGSEIRGMLRSNYEILTNSCMSVLDSDEVLGKRSSHIFEAGLIRKNQDGTYDLLEAYDCLWRTKGADSSEDELHWKKEYYKRKCYIQSSFLEGEKVYFTLKERFVRGRKIKPLAMHVSKERETSQQRSGYVIKGEASPKTKTEKHCCHIFAVKGNGQIKQKNISVKVLERALAQYKQNNEEAYKEYAKQFRKFLKQESEQTDILFPVYYSKVSKEDDYVMLSPACITREVYRHQLADLAGEFNSCEKAPFCPACSLFGTLGKKAAVASRVRMSDLCCEGDEWYDNIVTLPELASPKLNNMEFYLKRPPKAEFWTYDYYVDSQWKVHLWETPTLNGRKFYWHQLNMTFPKNVEETIRNMTVRPVKRGVKFRGKIFFSDISRKQLAELLWLLNCGDREELSEKRYGYKLGAGKPLGLGSVALAVDEVRIRKIGKKNHRIILEEEALKNGGQDVWSDECFSEESQKKLIPMFRKMTQFDLLEDVPFSYPVTKEQMRKGEFFKEGYEWFTKNHYHFDAKKMGKVGMGNNRAQMRFSEYMEAMEPKLQSVKSHKSGMFEGAR